jgi:ribosomal protein L6P/L9E
MIKRCNLKVGNIVPIYKDWKSQTELWGNAELIERLKSREPPIRDRMYEHSVINKNTKKNKDEISLIYTYQWWLVKFIDGSHQGFTTALKISYFYKTFWSRDYEKEIE